MNLVRKTADEGSSSKGSYQHDVAVRLKSGTLGGLVGVK